MAARWRSWAGVALVIAATVTTGLLSVNVWESTGGDIGGYASYANAFWHGSPRFYLFPQEYPPLALLPFTLALSSLPGAPLASYMIVFGALFVVGYLCFRRFASQAAATRYALYLLLGAQGTLLGRYDLAPSLLSVAALWLAERKHFGWAYAALVAGAGLKLYPLALLPVVAIAHYNSLRDTGRNSILAIAPVVVCAVASIVGAAALIFAPTLLTDQQATWLGYATHRPVQVESVPGTLVWLGTIFGARAHVEDSFGSQGWVGGLSGVVSNPFLALGAAGFLWLWWRQAQGKLSLERAAVASLCLLLVSGKVLSAQYLIWLLPVAALAGCLEPWWIAIAVLTSLEYPLLFPYSESLPPLTDGLVQWFHLTIALRNALLIALTLRLLLPDRDQKGVSQRDARGEAEPTLKVRAEVSHV